MRHYTYVYSALLHALLRQAMQAGGENNGDILINLASDRTLVAVHSREQLQDVTWSLGGGASVVVRGHYINFVVALAPGSTGGCGAEMLAAFKTFLATALNLQPASISQVGTPGLHWLWL